MPYSAKKICSHHVCNTAIQQGNRFCVDHKQPINIATKSTMYKTARWKKIRTAQLRDEPLCKKCAEFNYTTEATLVDHITPLQEGGDPFNYNNLQSLCNRCHNEKTGKEIRARHARQGSS